MLSSVTVRVESVDAAAFAEKAASILTEAWPPPAMRYTADYMRWQFSFPGRVRPLGFAAFDDDGKSTPIGFIGATPRRLRFRGQSSDGYLLSFVAVRPSHRGRGVAAALYDRILSRLRDAAVPVVMFTEPDSAGQRSMYRALEAARFRVKAFGRCPAYGCVVRPDPAVPAADSSPEAFRSVAARCNGGTTIWRDISVEELDHHRRDPRGCELLAPAGQGAAGMAVQIPFVTATGSETVITLNSPFIVDQDPQAIRALFQAAGRRSATGNAPVIVTATNLPGIDRNVLRAAGVRETLSRFNAYVTCADPDHPFLQAEATNVPVV